MALQKGTNSYATVAEADAYFGDRLGADAWRNASANDQPKALITATSVIDLETYASEKVDEDQPLEFPRVAYDPVPAAVITATYELALHFLKYPEVLVPGSSSGVDEIKIDVIEIKGLSGSGGETQKVPSIVYKLLKPFKLNGGSGGNIWHRAN